MMSQKTLIHSKKSNVLCFSSVKPLNFKEKYFKKNIKRIYSSLKLSPKKTVYAKQVHGKRIIAVKDAKVKLLQKADGFITNCRNILLVIFTADCLPVFIYDKNGRCAGIIHCGWRSTYKEIIKNAVSRMKKRYNVKPGDLKFVFGPFIGKCCYEVSGGLALKFRKKFGKKGIINRCGKSCLDLAEINKRQILSLKVPARNISIKKAYCTSCKDKLFYSYRRDGKGTGRMLNGIVIV